MLACTASASKQTLQYKLVSELNPSTSAKYERRSFLVQRWWLITKICIKEVSRSVAKSVRKASWQKPIWINIKSSIEDKTRLTDETSAHMLQKTPRIWIFIEIQYMNHGLFVADKNSRAYIRFSNTKVKFMINVDRSVSKIIFSNDQCFNSW